MFITLITKNMVIISLILIAIGAFFAVSAKNTLIRGMAVLITVLGVVGYFVFTKNDASPTNQQGYLTRDSVINKDGVERYILMNTPTVVEIKKEDWAGYSVVLCDTLQGKPVLKEVEITKTCYDTIEVGQRLNYIDFQQKLDAEQKEQSQMIDLALFVLKILSVVFVAGLVVILVIKAINGKLF